jgi:LacI family transcriptional regulator
LDGFKRALREAGLQLPPEYVQETTFDKNGGYAKTLVLLRLLPRPTAIFAGNDMIALGALLAIRDAGLRCPEDISLMGFDDLDIAEMTNPSLSSVSQSGYQLGTTAARILLDRLDGDKGPAKHLVLETALKLRNSVAPRSKTLRRTPATQGSRSRKLGTAKSHR